MHEWIDYKSTNQDGYEYSRFSKLYHDWCHEFQVHPKLLTNEVPGQCLHLDWAGNTSTCHFDGRNHLTVINFFVTSLGTSELPYVESFDSMDARHYTEATIHMLDFYGGVSKYVVSDNAKAEVIKNHEKEFELHQLFEEQIPTPGSELKLWSKKRITDILRISSIYGNCSYKVEQSSWM